jgi:malate synthase
VSTVPGRAAPEQQREQERALESLAKCHQELDDRRRGLVVSRTQRQTLIRAAKSKGCTWAQIGQVLGITKEGAFRAARVGEK